MRVLTSFSITKGKIHKKGSYQFLWAIPNTRAGILKGNQLKNVCMDEKRAQNEEHQQILDKSGKYFENLPRGYPWVNQAGRGVIHKLTLKP